MLADADTGYGNAVTVYDVVRRYEQAGAAGLIIEDQTWPKRCGHYPGLRSVISAEEMAGKIEAACEARSDPDFVIVARTDAARGLVSRRAVHRANLYHTAGAALVFADAIPTEEEVLQFAQEVDGPVAFHAGLGLQSLASIPDIPPNELERHGAAQGHVLKTAASGRDSRVAYGCPRILRDCDRERRVGRPSRSGGELG